MTQSTYQTEFVEAVTETYRLYLNGDLRTWAEVCDSVTENYEGTDTETPTELLRNIRENVTDDAGALVYFDALAKSFAAPAPPAPPPPAPVWVAELRQWRVIVDGRTFYGPSERGPWEEYDPVAAEAAARALAEQIVDALVAGALARLPQEQLAAAEADVVARDIVAGINAGAASVTPQLPGV